jgi:hypothetical protein
MTCDKTSLVDWRNNLFVGFQNGVVSGYPANYPITNDNSNPIFSSLPSYPFTNPGSVFDHNLTYRPKSNWSCPSAGETNAICGVDPQLTDETWHLYGYGNTAPAPGTGVVIGAGVSIPGVTLDYSGQTRGNPPSIGAQE